MTHAMESVTVWWFCVSYIVCTHQCIYSRGWRLEQYVLMFIFKA